jgi:hypothetical protein
MKTTSAGKDYILKHCSLTCSHKKQTIPTHIPFNTNRNTHWAMQKFEVRHFRVKEI